MALDQSALYDLLEVLRTAESGQFVNRLLTGALQALIELEATAAIGAAPHERTPARLTQRNGSRPKTIATAAGDVTVAIPKTRTGSFPVAARAAAAHGRCTR
ncbi:MAG: transposase [Mycobacterium leprae]